MHKGPMVDRASQTTVIKSALNPLAQSQARSHAILDPQVFPPMLKTGFLFYFHNPGASLLAVRKFNLSQVK